MSGHSDVELQAYTARFKEQISGKSLEDILLKPMCGARVEAPNEHAILMFRSRWDCPQPEYGCGNANGEGKTLVATLPLFECFDGKGTHVVTVNAILLHVMHGGCLRFIIS